MSLFNSMPLLSKLFVAYWVLVICITIIKTSSPEKRLTFIGATLVLSAWITQQFYFDELNNLTAALDQVESDYWETLSTNSLLLAFGETATPSQREKLKLACQRTQERMRRRLRQACPGFFSWPYRTEPSHDDVMKGLQSERESLTAKRNHARWWFVALYVIGSLFALVELWQPRQVSEVTGGRGSA